METSEKRFIINEKIKTHKGSLIGLCNLISARRPWCLHCGLSLRRERKKKYIAKVFSDCSFCNATLMRAWPKLLYFIASIIIMRARSNRFYAHAHNDMHVKYGVYAVTALWERIVPWFQRDYGKSDNQMTVSLR